MFKNLDKFTRIKMFLFFQSSSYACLFNTRIAKEYKDLTLKYVDYVRDIIRINRSMPINSKKDCSCHSCSCGKVPDNKK
jgi:hypothetical protein